MRVRTILLGGFGVIMAGLLLGVAFVTQMDFSTYKGVIIRQVEQGTGRKLTLAGDLKLSIFPTPSLIVKNVSLANADWGSRGEMTTFGELSAQIALWPLIFGGHIHITLLTLTDADVLLETDGKGHSNWKFGAITPTHNDANSAKSDGTELPSFDRVLFKNVMLTYRNGLTRKSTTATLTELSTSGSLTGPMEVKASVESSGAILKVDGTVGDPLTGRNLNLALTVDGKGIASFLKPFHISTSVTGGADTALNLGHILGSFGASTLNGEASFDLTKPQTKVTATLNVPVMDITEFPTAPSPARSGYTPVFSNDPLPIEELGDIDADVILNITALKTEKLAVENLSAHILLVDRDLNIKPLGLDLVGSHVGGEIELSARHQPPVLTFRLGGTQVDIGKILTLLTGDNLLEGRGNFDVSVNGAGTSLHAIMASLDGTTTLVVGHGVIKSRYVDLIGADVFREAFAWTKGKKDTTLNCLVSRFDIRKGVATAHGLLMDTSDVSMLGVGTLNLGTEQLDLELTPRPKETSLLHLAVPIDIGGTFANPTIEPNKFAMAKQVAGGVASTLNPLIAIGALVLDNTGDSDRNPCVTALENGKSSAEKANKGGITGTVKNLGNMIDGIFK